MARGGEFMEEESTQPQERSMNAIVTVVVILIIIAGAGLFLLNSRKASAPTSDTMTTQTTSAPTEAIKTSPAASNEGSMNAAEKKFTVHASNFSFDTKTMTVKKGDTVTITFMNDQGTHDWVLDAFNVKTKIIPAGQTDTVTFMADKTGTFEYYCSVGSHRAMGMVGSLKVQ